MDTNLGEGIVAVICSSHPNRREHSAVLVPGCGDVVGRPTQRKSGVLQE